MSDLLEKSLDEIIGDTKPKRGSRGQRREDRPRRSNDDERDRSRDRRGSSRRGGYRERGERSHERVSRDGKDSRLQRLIQGRFYIKIMNLHYDITEKELGLLLSQVGRLTFHYIEFDRSGRSTGTAYAQYGHLEDNDAAVEKFNNRMAGGKVISVELIKPLRIKPVSREERPSRSARPPRRGKATAEDLDKELEDYMNGGASEQKEEEKSAPRAKRGKVTTEDLDKELEDYMAQDKPEDQPFPSVE